VKFRHAFLAGALLVALFGTQAPGFARQDPALTEQDIPTQIEQVRRATARFRDPQVAEREHYARFLDCVDQPGQGAMGIHYLHATFPSDAILDPLHPEALVYEPDTDGKLRLVAVEYIAFQDTWDALNGQPPSLFGHPFHLVRAPNRFGVAAFYELHFWVWRPNPDGRFNDWNPLVRCP
jgi:hypothetical protein